MMLLTVTGGFLVVVVVASMVAWSIVREVLEDQD